MIRLTNFSNKIFILISLLLVSGTLFFESLSNKNRPSQFSSEWLRTNFAKSNIDFSEIAEHKIPKDYNQVRETTLIDTKFVKFLAANEPVISININGNFRAYPLRFLLYHNVINDSFAGADILVTYSPLSNAAIIYNRRINDKIFTFAHTGRFRQGNFLLYDEETYSWWQQFNGTAIVGNMLDSKLEQLPARIESFAKFKKRAPNSKIMIVKHQHDYGVTPFTNYDSMRMPAFYTPNNYPKVPAMSYIITADNQAWLLEDLKDKKQIIKDNIKIIWSPGQSSVLDTEKISEGKDIGNIVVQKKNKKGKYQDIPYIVPFAFTFKTFTQSGTTNYSTLTNHNRVPPTNVL